MIVAQWILLLVIYLKKIFEELNTERTPQIYYTNLSQSNFSSDSGGASFFRCGKGSPYSSKHSLKRLSTSSMLLTSVVKKIEYLGLPDVVYRLDGTDNLFIVRIAVFLRQHADSIHHVLVGHTRGKVLVHFRHVIRHQFRFLFFGQSARRLPVKVDSTSSAAISSSSSISSAGGSGSLRAGTLQAISGSSR